MTALARFTTCLGYYVRINARWREGLPKLLYCSYGPDMSRNCEQAWFFFLALRPDPNTPEGEILNGWRVWSIEWPGIAWEMRYVGAIDSSIWTGRAVTGWPSFRKHHR